MRLLHIMQQVICFVSWLTETAFYQAFVPVLRSLFNPEATRSDATSVFYCSSSWLLSESESSVLSATRT